MIAFIIASAICTSLFIGVMQLKPANVTARPRQRTLQGILLLIPSLGLIAAAVAFFQNPVIDVHAYIAYCLIGLSASFFAWLVYEIIRRRKDKSIAARYSRLIQFATMSVPLALIVGITLALAEVEDLGMLVCLSTATFGGTSLLIALDLILVSLCGFQSTRESLKTINDLLKRKKLVFVRISLAKDVFMVLAKTTLSVIAASFFMFANALHSVGLGVARLIAVKMHTQSREKQLHSYFRVGSVIFFASTCYVIYSIRLFYKSSTTSIPMVVGIAIACYTFVEFGINIREVWMQRKSKALEVKALRAISLSSTLLCFVLTQTALTSLTPDSDTSFYNALSGVIFGGIAALVGTYVMIRSWFLKKAL